MSLREGRSPTTTELQPHVHPRTQQAHSPWQIHCDLQALATERCLAWGETVVVLPEPALHTQL